MLVDLILRVVAGGLVVMAFAVLGNFLKPKSFAGLFGAAPSVALATLTLAVLKNGKQYASVEARSMMLGAIALGAYSFCVGYLLVRRRIPALRATLYSLPVWLAVALGLCFVIFTRGVSGH